MSSSGSEKKLEKADIDDSWIDVSDEFSNLPYRDPAIAIAGDGASHRILECELCHVSFSGVESYQQHMIGSKHKRKQQKDLMKKKYGPKYLEMLKNQASGSEIHSEVTDTENKDDEVVLKYCDVCKKICTGEITYELHIRGKHHQKKVRQMKLVKKLQANLDVNLNEKREDAENSVYDAMHQVKPFAQCDICNKKFTGPEGFQDHLSSVSHKKKLGIQELSKKLSGEKSSCDLVKDESAMQNAESSEDGDFFMNCSVCQKYFSGPVPYQQHLISDAHKKTLKKIELTKKMNSLSVKCDETDTFACKECDRSFRIPEEFDQHLKSSAHTKKKIKHEMVQKLKDDYPEMVIQPVAASEVDSLENGILQLEKSFILMCEVCHKSFSGPETARTHFISPKHSKAKRQLIILEQQRKMENNTEMF